MKKTDTERLKKIVSLWDALSSEIERRGITREMLLTEQFSQWAVTTPVYNIGEQVYQLSPEFKKEHPDVPWSVVSGLRHRLVHDYDGTPVILRCSFSRRWQRRGPCHGSCAGR